MILIAVAFIVVLILAVVGSKFYFDRKKPEDIVAQHKGTELSNSVFVKKYPEADVSKFVSTFMLVGSIITLLTVIAYFQYQEVTENDYIAMDMEGLDDFEVEPPQTQREPPPPPPPPPPENQIVEDEEVIEEEPEIEIEEIEEETVIEVPEPVEEEVVNEQEFFIVVEDMPCFNATCCSKATNDERKKCTEGEMMKYLGKVKYPPIAKENDIEGVVYIRFLIDKVGKVSEVSVARGADKILNDAAVNHMKKMPKFAQPGKQRGKPVKVQYVVPIRFKLG